MENVGSVPLGLFPADSVNDGYPLFDRDALLEIGDDWPHMVFESYQSYSESTEERILKFPTPEILLDKLGRSTWHDARPTADVEAEWDNFEKAIDAPDVPMPHIAAYRDVGLISPTAESALQELTIHRAGVSKFFLLGMGSLHDKIFGKIAVQQYLLAARIITQQSPTRQE